MTCGNAASLWTLSVTMALRYQEALAIKKKKKKKHKKIFLFGFVVFHENPRRLANLQRYAPDAGSTVRSSDQE